VIVDIESTVSFEVSLSGPEGFGTVSVGILPFPFEIFRLTLVVCAEGPDRNSISGEMEREPVVIRP